MSDTPACALLIRLMLGALVASACWAGSAPAATTVMPTTSVSPLTSPGAALMTGRLNRDGAIAACGSSKPVPALFNATPRYIAGVFAVANAGTSPECLTYTAASACAKPVTPLLYGFGLDQANPQTGYLADSGNSTDAGTRVFGRTLTPGDSAIFVVQEVERADPICGAINVGVTSDIPYPRESPTVAAGTDPLTLAASDIWAAPPAPTVSRQWQRCTPACANVGAPADAYTVGPADVGGSLRVVSNASVNDGGIKTNSAVGEQTPPLGPLAPRALVTPSTTEGAAIVPAADRLDGSDCDDCAIAVTPPFPIAYDGRDLTTSLRAESNGRLSISDGARSPYVNTALPDAETTSSLAPLWDDFQAPNDATHGIFTGTVGTAPNRQWVVEWRTNFRSTANPANFEVIFREGDPTVSYVYGAITGAGANATIGAQSNFVRPFADQIAFNTAGAAPAGRRIDLVASRPAVAGTPKVGDTLTATDPAWDGPDAGSLALSRQWVSCDAAGAGCSPVAGATGTSFIPPAALAGRTVRLDATADAGARGTTTVSSPLTGPVAALPPPPALKLTGVRLSGRLTVDRKGRASGKKVTIAGVLSRAGTFRVVVERPATGRRKGTACVKPTTKNRRARRCTRYVKVGTLFRPSDAGGRVTITITGKVEGKRLAPGTYRLTPVAIGVAGGLVTGKKLTLTVKAAKTAKKG